MRIGSWAISLSANGDCDSLGTAFQEDPNRITACIDLSAVSLLGGSAAMEGPTPMHVRPLHGDVTPPCTRDENWFLMSLSEARGRPKLPLPFQPWSRMPHHPHAPRLSSCALSFAERFRHFSTSRRLGSYRRNREDHNKRDRR